MDPRSLADPASALGDALAAAGTRRRFRAGTALFHEGDPSDHVALIVSGRVKIAASGANGGVAVLAIRGPGDLVGELSAIDGRPRSAAAFVLEPVEAWVVSASTFHQILAERPGAAVGLLTTLVSRLRDADRRRVEFGSLPALARVARCVAGLAADFGTPEPGGAIRISLPVTQDELAGWVGASRESVARALAALRSAGIVRTARKVVTVVDMERLHSLGG